MNGGAMLYILFILNDDEIRFERTTYIYGNDLKNFYIITNVRANNFFDYINNIYKVFRYINIICTSYCNWYFSK